jgi:hypothetical protein
MGFLSSNNTADPSYTKSDNLIPMIFRSLPSVISALTFSNYLLKNQMLYQFSHRSANLYICLYFYLSLCPFQHTSINLYICLHVSLSFSLSVSTQVNQSLFFTFVCLSLYFRLCPFPHRLVNPYNCLSTFLFIHFHSD